MTCTYGGIDGCRAGWFCVFLDPDDGWDYRLAPDAQVLAQSVRQVSTALIDIPIGLLDQGRDERRCDVEARRLLGRPRSASVFAAPVRAALGATDYVAAGNTNRRLTGRGLSRQSWALVPKIRDVDNLLRDFPALRGVLRECHPEVGLCMLNGGRAMLGNKKQARGREERLEVLRRYFPAADALLRKAAARYLRRQVALDDVIDAMVSAVTAKWGDGAYRTLPAERITDSRGNAMEIVYWQPV